MTLAIDKSTWKKVKFGDVAKQVKDRVDPATSGITRYVAGEHMDTDELRISRWGEVGDGYLGPAFHMRFKPGHVLYGSRRTYLRKVAVADFDGICANTTFVIAPSNPKALLPTYLPFIMSSEPFHKHSNGESKGSVNPYVNWPDLAKFEFLLPPLADQQRIADLLWTIEGHRLNLGSEADVLHDRVLSSRVSQLLTGPNEHPTMRLGEIAAWRSGKTPKAGTKAFYHGGTIPWAVIADLEDGPIEDTKTKITKAGADEVGHLVEPGAVLVSMYGTIGRTAIVTRTMTTNQAILAGTPDTKKVTSEFLYWTLRSLAPRLESLGRGATQMNINRSIVAEQQVRVPPIDEQMRIVNAISDIQTSASAVLQEVSLLNDLRASLLGSVFG